MSQRLQKILSEIEPGNESAETLAARKTMPEVIEILLNKPVSQNAGEESGQKDSLPVDSDQTSSFQMDMDEIQRHRAYNNQGYSLSYYWPLHSNRKFVGKIIATVKKVIRKCLFFLLSPLIERQNAFNASVTASINALYNNDILTQSFIDYAKVSIGMAQEQQAKIQQLEGTLHEFQMEQEKSLRQCQENLKYYTKKHHDKIDQLAIQYQETLEIFRKETKELSDRLSDNLSNYSEITEKINEILQEYETSNAIIASNVEATASNAAAIANLEDVVSGVSKEQLTFHALNQEIQHMQNVFDLRMRKMMRDQEHSEMTMLRFVNQNLIGQSVSQILRIATTEAGDEHTDGSNTQTGEEIVVANPFLQDEAVYDTIDYFEFENNFRGSRQDIKERQGAYLKYFEEGQTVVDIGCGRGEFLELLDENGVQTTGVDSYQEFVRFCKFKGLNAVCEDAIAYVANMEDASVDGITGFQIAEHLTTLQLVTLCNRAYNKLKPGGHFILETPNPTCLSMFTNNFYLDPSHEKPIHPQTLHYFLGKAGFKKVDIVFTEESKENYHLPLLDVANCNNLAEFNDGINLLSDLVFGSQDYAIVATK
jgi:2-polyprenyl-3-methyl-5-hydroxy-6-metoxy-1,4-benzoquinol methylase